MQSQCLRVCVCVCVCAYVHLSPQGASIEFFVSYNDQILHQMFDLFDATANYQRSVIGERRIIGGCGAKISAAASWHKCAHLNKEQT